MAETTKFLGILYPGYGDLQKTDCDILGLLYFLAENNMIGENLYIGEEVCIFELFGKDMKFKIWKYFCRNFGNNLCTKHKISYLHGERITFYDRKKLIYYYKTVYRIKDFPKVYWISNYMKYLQYYDRMAIIWNTSKFLSIHG